MERAIDYLFSHSEEKEEEVKVDDIPPKYQLKGFITHLGASANCGHYVAHVRKNGEWIYYNDHKVAATKTPQVQEGYIYLFERV